MHTPDLTRIVEPPQTCMSGGRGTHYFDLDDAHRVTAIQQAGGPLDAPDALPMGGAWNTQVHDMRLSYGSVLRAGWM